MLHFSEDWSSSLSICSDRTLLTITHLLTLFSGPTVRPRIISCPWTVTTRKGTTVTLSCVVSGNPKPRVTLLQPVDTASSQTRTNPPKSQSDNSNNWMNTDIDGLWMINLTVTPEKNEAYMVTATSSINRGWGSLNKEETWWINVIVTNEWEHVSFMHIRYHTL